MTIWILLIVVTLIITLAVLVYKHDNTEFARLTGYSLFDIVLNAKKSHLHKLMTQLDKVSGEHKVLIDLHLPINNTNYPVDAILIHESGVYVIDGVKKTGWISGNEEQTEWVELKHKEKQEMFPNPITVNKHIVLALRELLPEVNPDAYVAISLFSDACSFQKIEIHSQNVEVMKRNELKLWTKQIGGEVLSKEEIHTIYKALEGYMSFKQQPTKEASKQPVTN